MSDDIVTRLRALAKALEMGEWPALTETCATAADEIERLRAERDAARRWVCRFDADSRSNDARSCGMSDHFNCPKQIAQERGWDCFKEKP